MTLMMDFYDFLKVFLNSLITTPSLFLMNEVFRRAYTHAYAHVRRFRCQTELLRVQFPSGNFFTNTLKKNTNLTSKRQLRSSEAAGEKNSKTGL